VGNVKKLCARLGISVLFAALFPAIAEAQVPSYAQAGNASDEETIHGRIAAVSGQFDLAVRDDRGFVDSVQLHPGTIINPTGLALAPGMSVTILGYNRGKVFSANEIDAPYTSSYGYPADYAPVYAYGADDPYWDWNIGPVYGGWGYGGWYGGGWGYGGWYGGYGRGGGWGGGYGHGGNHGGGSGGHGGGGGGFRR
jgi:hypothetical protein